MELGFDKKKENCNQNDEFYGCRRNRQNVPGGSRIEETARYGNLFWLVA